MARRGWYSGTKLSIGRLIALGEEVRGGKFSIDAFTSEELEAGTYEPSWLPKVEHPPIHVASEHADAVSKSIIAELLLAVRENTFGTSDERNKSLPNYGFADAEVFLKEAWCGKP